MTPLRKQFLQELDQFLEPQGFHRKSSKFHGDRYIATLGGVSTLLPISCRSGGGRSVCIEIQSVSVRFEEVERLIAECEPPDPLVKDDDYDARGTISVLLNDGLLSGLLRKSWHLEAEDQVAKVAGQVARYGLKQVNWIRGQYANPETALQILICNDRNAGGKIGPDHIRAKKAIAMTLLFHGTSRAQRLATQKLASLSGDGKAELNKWLEKLWQKHSSTPG